MEPMVASRIVALRPALEMLIVKTTHNPQALEQPDARDAALMEVVRSLSKVSTGRHGLQTPGSDGLVNFLRILSYVCTF